MRLHSEEKNRRGKKIFDKTSFLFQRSFWQGAFGRITKSVVECGNFFADFLLRMASAEDRSAWRMIRTACRIRSRIRGYREGDLNDGWAESRTEVQNPRK